MSIIDEREKTHGPFERTASVFLELRDAIAQHAALHTPVQTVALDMIAFKIARILAGDPNEPDHWRDIAGYAELVVRSLEAGK